ncbi:J domain-containing protein, partial [Pyxidicoccus sp. 3LFB2]
MKPFEQQTYYELLEVPVSAPVDDIRAAYSRLMELYAPDSIAVYALVDPEQVDSLRARMTEAMEILTDADLRAEYDKDLGLPTRRMVEAVAAGGKPSNEATPGAGAVARVAEALASSAAVSGEEKGRAVEEPARAATSTPPPVEPAPSSEALGDFRATFFRGFSFAYVSSSLQDTQHLGSSVYVPSAMPRTQVPSELGTSAPNTSSSVAVSTASEAGASAPAPVSVSAASAAAAANVTEAATAAPVPAAASVSPEPSTA